MFHPSSWLKWSHQSSQSYNQFLPNKKSIFSPSLCLFQSETCLLRWRYFVMTGKATCSSHPVSHPPKLCHTSNPCSCHWQKKEVQLAQLLRWQKFIVFPGGTRKGPSWGVSPTPCQCGRKLIDAVTVSCAPQKSCPAYMPGSIFSRASTCLSMCLSGDYLNYPGNPSMLSNMSWASPTQSLQSSKYFEY